MSTNPEDNGRRRVVVAPMLMNNRGYTWMKVVIPIWIASAVVNLAIVGLAAGLFSLLGKVQAESPEDLDQQVQTTQVEEPPKEDWDLTQTDIGTDTQTPYNLDVERTGEDVVVPGVVDPTQSVGVPDAPADAARSNVPLPPGSGGGLGGALPNLNDAQAIGGLSSSLGGMGGSYLGNQFAGRSAGTRQRMLNEQGGNPLSEAKVGEGLQWLALHQAQDGHWSLHEFNHHAREKPRPGGKVFRCNCKAETGNRNDIAATAFGVLPFLAAGITHKPGKPTQKDYSKTVDGAVNWLIGKQSQKGSYSDDMYAHGIATIAMCEAYGLTSDPRIKMSAQKALNFVVNAQDSAGGGWRYGPKPPDGGDTSVTGWQLMALKSGQMAGLSVPKNTLKLSERFLDSVESAPKGSSDKGGSFTYRPGQPPTITMTSVGLLCRQYSGIGPKNPSLQAGVKQLREQSPGKNDNIYYLYYATQVMHHMQGDSWRYWNLGPNGDGKGGIRDTLIARQDKGNTPQYPHQAGSWGGSQGGRIMATSLSLLCLEVYYRHLPLYRRDISSIDK
ncbi:MAG TPA: prenyltransferase/squalene oxidase repeat-containing protein [Gemmataceae bacterium]|nr:prenyltransferase/squalene oxidase repeat-containing protein [Gemmataceae bacterium]